MPQAANIVINDGAATPVAHTFVPIGPDKDGIWWYEEQGVASSAIGNNRLSVEVKSPPPPSAGTSSKDRNYRIKFGLHTPVLEALSNNSAGYTPSPTVAYTPRVFTEYVFSERSTKTERKNIRSMSYNLWFNGNIINIVDDLQRFF